MKEIIDVLSVILPIFSGLLVLAVISINIYIKIRSKFSIRVNCWFCNEYTRVPYIEKNSFVCPSCTQYNGFDYDGGYNKSIPEQHYEILNTFPSLNNQNSPLASSNGLCRICNNNQQLKIYQLANFIPLNQNNFDLEIEHFQKQLENAYKLCPKCDSILKKRISKQTKWMLGLKIKHLRNKGLAYLNLNESSNKISKEKKKSYFLLFLNLSIILIAFLILINVLSNFNLSINKHLIHYFLPIFAFIKNNAFNVFSTLQSQLKLKTDFDLNQIHNISVINQLSNSYPNFKSSYSSIFILSTTGLFLQCVVSLFDNSKAKFHAFEIMLWMVVNGALYYENFLNIYRGIMIFSTICILYIKLYANRDKRKPTFTKTLTPKKLSTRKSQRESYSDGSISLNSNKNVRHNSTDLSDTDTAESDYETFNTFHLNKTKRSKKSKPANTVPIFGEKSVLQNSLNRSKSPVFFNDFNNLSGTFHTAKCVAAQKVSIFNQHGLNTTRNDLNSPLNRPHNDLNQSLNNTLNNTSNHTLNKTINLDVNSPLRHTFSHSPRINNSNTNSGFGTQSFSQGSFNNYRNRKDNNSLSMNPGLNQSLDNLNLFSGTNRIERPLISPPKLNVQRNPWTGNFWDQNNFSRTSSQSSGFVSQHSGHLDQNSLPNSRSNSTLGDFDRNSIISEPAYHPSAEMYNQMTDLSSNKSFSSTNNRPGQCFPCLNPNDHILIQGKQYFDNFNMNGLRNQVENDFSGLYNNVSTNGNVNNSTYGRMD